MSTVLAQIKACMNSRPLGPLAPLPAEEDALEALTPRHFLVGKALEALCFISDNLDTSFLESLVTGVSCQSQEVHKVEVPVQKPPSGCPA